ncbi:MAG: endonuclease VIII [Gammaproteobacteria bacterium]|nr:endonuclease VIII [Gammaproteobacteria bacterium]
MPEGPEMRRAADELAAILLRRKAQAVRFGLEPLRAYESILTGRRITEVACRGKAVLLRFGGGNTIYAHNQLYGRWYVQPRGGRPRTNRQLRVCIDTREHSALLYSASDIGIYDEDSLARHPYLAKLGPEVLDPHIDAGAIERRLASRVFYRRSLAALYLDQSFLAGVGNYLRSEILFVARIDPTLRALDLDRNDRRRLARASLAIPRRSYETGGITNSPANVRRLHAAGQKRGKYRFWVFGSAGKPCQICGSEIARIQLSGRRLYFCPVCQGY